MTLMIIIMMMMKLAVHECASGIIKCLNPKGWRCGFDPSTCSSNLRGTGSTAQTRIVDEIAQRLLQLRMSDLSHKERYSKKKAIIDGAKQLYGAWLGENKLKNRADYLWRIQNESQAESVDTHHPSPMQLRLKAITITTHKIMHTTK